MRSRLDPLLGRLRTTDTKTVTIQGGGGSSTTTIVNGGGAVLTSGAVDPVSPTTFDLFYNTTSHTLKIYLYDTWVSFINYKDIMLTDQNGDVITDQNGYPIFETNTIDYVRT